MEKEQRPHKKLEVWKNSMELAKIIYKITGSFPSSELYGLVSQMRRAAVSVSSNIAEGAARSGKKEFLQLTIFHFTELKLSDLGAEHLLSK